MPSVIEMNAFAHRVNELSPPTKQAEALIHRWKKDWARLMDVMLREMRADPPTGARLKALARDVAERVCGAAE